jgi:O-antigen/teichoic acid export membrane protein
MLEGAQNLSGGLMVHTGTEDRSSQIIRNVLMNWVAFAVTILAGFLMSPFLVRHLGDAVYGVWVLLGSLAGYLGLLDFGLIPSMVKYVAEYRARNDQRALNRLMTAGLVAYSIMGLVSLALSLAIAFTFNDIFHSPVDDRTAAAIVFIAGLNLAVAFPSSVFVGLIRGYQRYDIDARVTSLLIVMRNLLIVPLILRGHGILTVALITFLFDMSRLLYLVRKAWQLNPEIRFARAYFDRAELRRLFSFSFFVFIIIVSKHLIFYTDSIIIGLFLSTSAVTAYFIASRLVTYLLALVSEMVGVLAPRASELSADDDQRGIRELLTVSTKYMLLTALPAATVFFVMGENFITLWMGPSFANSAQVLTILTIAILSHLMLMPSETILLGMGKHRVVARLMIVQAVANLGLSLALVRPMGIRGVALGTAIPMACFLFASLFIYYRYHFRLPLGDYLRRSIPAPLAAQVPFAALILLFKTYAPPSSLAMFFVEVTAAFLPYGALAFFFFLSSVERRPFLRLAEKFGLKLSPRFS